MPTLIPSPADVIDFPIDNPRLKIVNHKGHLYVIERHYRWDPQKKRGVDDRTYVGKVHEGRYYSMDVFRQALTSQKVLKNDWCFPLDRQAAFGPAGQGAHRVFFA